MVAGPMVAAYSVVVVPTRVVAVVLTAVAAH
jgi:hypothetical protein